jgi:HD-GYP domain-containing protein (c-di-GMP phosphodiesterase class II)/putative methionine-R-sulfoxide reductase with GAF domain
MTTARHYLRLYVGFVAAAGIGIVLHSLYVLSLESIGYQWFVLAGLTLLSGSFTIRIPTIPARLSVSETFVFAAAILFGPAAATIIVVLDTLIISLWLRRASQQVSRVLFNVTAAAIAIWVASHAFFSLAGIQPLYVTQRPILSLVVHILILALLYFLLNSWLIAVAVGFEKRISPFVVWRENFLWLSLNYFSGASVAALLLPYLQDEQGAFIRITGFLIPLLLISYLTFKTALGRVEDANQHLTELNRLYLSTIETLAMAIDAKDQITHGHIRRLQQYATGLAKRVGITDAGQVRAIEAASLLHDMGKLAVPEYILNKPGKLTPAEFEKMKVQASVGADILSAIDFPYPVVPIVRHHHENWDGTGYPDGIAGENIPIGARILSVVDCFDALTSDRPYRPRLSDAEAIKILLDRRGSMYDPLVVDRFIKMQEEIGANANEVTNDPQQISTLSRDSSTTEIVDAGSGLDDITASSEEMLILFDLAKNLTGRLRFAEAGEAISKHLRRLVPASTCVLYVYDPVVDDLTVAYAAGEHSGQFQGLRIPRGERLTGWVAANRQSILNSDPVLDLGEVARSLKPRLYSCLGIPSIHEGTLIGVLTLYSSQRDAFTQEHRRISEAVARQASLTLKLAAGAIAESEIIPIYRSSDSDVKSIDEFHGNWTVAALSIAYLKFETSSNRSTEFDDDSFYQVARAMRKALRDRGCFIQIRQNRDGCTSRAHECRCGRSGRPEGGRNYPRVEASITRSWTRDDSRGDWYRNCS